MSILFSSLLTSVLFSVFSSSYSYSPHVLSFYPPFLTFSFSIGIIFFLFSFFILIVLPFLRLILLPLLLHDFYV
jgi:hypothetical protein